VMRTARSRRSAAPMASASLRVRDAGHVWWVLVCPGKKSVPCGA
jgi:hypothetical protein